MRFLLITALLLFLGWGTASAQVTKDSCYSVQKGDTVWETTCTEKQPEFTGGFPELMKFLQHNIRYPQLPKEWGVQGKVFIGFVIDTDGSIIDVELLKGVKPPASTDPKEQVIYEDAARQLNEEALRVIRMMPAWQPAYKGNTPVKAKYNLPIKFSLG